MVYFTTFEGVGCLKIPYEQEGGTGKVVPLFFGEGLEEKVSDQNFCSNYYPFGFVMNQYLSNGEKYRFGYQGDFAEDDTEETGFNHFEARQYDPRIGRWSTIDPAMVDYSPYVGMANNPVVAVDPSGEYPIITITKIKTGTAFQRVLGFLRGDKDVITQVDLYKVIVTDTEDPNFKMDFAISRDGWAMHQDGTHLVNTGFEPKFANQNIYDAKLVQGGSYPEGNGTTAFKLFQKGSEWLHAAPNQWSFDAGIREVSPTVAIGVMLHVGGLYDYKGKLKFAGSYGCFGVCDPNGDVSNTFSNSILDAIINQANLSETDPGKIEVIIEQRTGNDYPATKDIDN